MDTFLALVDSCLLLEIIGTDSCFGFTRSCLMSTFNFLRFFFLALAGEQLLLAFIWFIDDWFRLSIWFLVRIDIVEFINSKS